MDKATFLSAAAFKRTAINVEGLGAVHIREISAADAKEYYRRNAEADGDKLDLQAWLVTRVVCDPDGNLILSDADVAKVRAIPIRVLKEVCDQSAKLSGFGGSDADAKKKRRNGRRN